MLRLVLDTNAIYQKLGARNAVYLKLRALSGAQLLEILVPSVVKYEAISQMVHEREKLGAQLQRVQKDLLTGFEASHLVNARSVADAAWEGVDALFDEWCEEFSVVVAEIESAHAERVFRGYSRGEAPFVGKRSRDDLPDAFLLEYLRDLCASHGPDAVHFVTTDRGLARAAAEEGIVVHRTVHQFLQSDVVRPLVSELDDLAEDKLDKLIAMIDANERSLCALLDAKLREHLSEFRFVESSFRSADGPVTIIEVENVFQVTPDFAEAQHWDLRDGVSVLVIPYNATIDASIEFALFRSDWNLLDDEKAELIALTGRSKHYFNAAEHVLLGVAGTVDFEVPQGDLEDLKSIEARLQDFLATEWSSFFEVDEISIMSE